jgi:hypothetical protein
MSTTLTGTYSGIITAGVTLALDTSTIAPGATVTSYGYGAVVSGGYGTVYSLLNLGTVEGGTSEAGISLSQGLVTNGIGGLVEGSVGVYIGTGTLVDAGTIMALGSGGVAVSFGNAAGDALTLTKSGVIEGGIAGLTGTDSIDLVGITATSESFSAGTLTLYDHGHSVASLSLVGGFNTSEFTLGSDGQGGTNITLGTEILTGTYTGSFSLTALDTTITTDALFSLTTGGIASTAQHPVTLVNQGSVITNGLFGSAITVFDGAVTNAASGVIDITGGAGFGVDVLAGSLVNAGTISQSVKEGTGAYLLSGELINQASGVIVGPTGAGVNHGTIVNFGLISGSAADGIGIYIGLNQQVSRITNAMGGIIQGSLGVELTRGTLINAGMIRSTAPTGGVAVQFGIFDDVLVVDPGSTIIGNVAGMIAGNTIDIANEVITKTQFADGALTLSNKSGALDTIALSGNLNNSEFTLSSDGIGGTDVTIGTEIVTGHYTAGFTLSALNTTIDASARLSATGGSYALYGSAARNWTVLNQGIVNGHTGDGLVIGTGGTITNTQSASITGKVGVQISTGTLVNDGVITGTKSYGANVGSGVLTNATSGTISGLYGVFVGSTTVTNDGTIAGNVAGKGYGAVGLDATIINNAGGVISGYIGAYSGNGTIINAGTIEGTAGIGIALGPHANTIVIDHGSTIIGAIAGFAASDTLDFAKTKLDGATFANGYLTLSEHGKVVATYGMVGQFTSGEFALGKDGHGGTDVTLGAAVATGTYTGLTLTSLYTSFTASAQVVGSSTVAAVFGSSLSSWTVVNAGALVDTTTGDGVKLAGAGSLTNQTGGYIAGYNGAYVNSGTVVNGGTMTGVFNGAEVIFGAVNNQAGGTLSGFFGTYVYNGTIINAGTIESTNGIAGTAAITGGFQGTVIDDPGAVFIGQVVGGTEASGVSLLELGSGASEGILSGYGTQFVNFRTLEVAPGATWDIAGTTTIAGTLINDGTIIETAADTLDITGTLEGTGTIRFDPTTGIFNGPVGAGQVIDFSGAGSTIVLGDPTQFAGTLSGFAAGDVLSLPSLSGLSGASYANGTLVLSGSFGTIDLAVTNSPALSAGVGIVEGPTGPELNVHCFATGTRIATARGEIAVESLVVGDLARRADGGFAPIVWRGERTVHPARHPRPETINPVVIAANALADGVPTRDLTVSPDHALWLDGHLIPAKALVNGATIRQIPVDCITYHHVELSAHAALLAEGAAAESYLDSGDRADFEAGHGAMRLHPDFAQAMRATSGFAPFAETGPVVEAVRTRLLSRAAIGLTDDAALRIVATESGALITSRHFIPAELTADPRDRRRLGVKIAALHIAGRAVPLDHPDLITGWHACEADGRWTNGAGLIPASVLAGASAESVVVTLASAALYRDAA